MGARVRLRVGLFLRSRDAPSGVRTVHASLLPILCRLAAVWLWRSRARSHGHAQAGPAEHHRARGGLTWSHHDFAGNPWVADEYEARDTRQIAAEWIARERGLPRTHRCREQRADLYGWGGFRSCGRDAHATRSTGTPDRHRYLGRHLGRSRPNGSVPRRGPNRVRDCTDTPAWGPPVRIVAASVPKRAPNEPSEPPHPSNQIPLSLPSSSAGVTASVSGARGPCAPESSPPQRVPNERETPPGIPPPRSTRQGRRAGAPPSDRPASRARCG